MNFTKYFHTQFIFPCIIICGLISCEKLSDNGDLDGKWHLTTIYTKPSETEQTYSEVHDKYDKGIYWMFQMQLLNIRTRSIPENVYSRDIIARFNHTGNMLHITETYVHFRERDSLLTDPKTNLMDSIGIRSNTSSYRIKELNNDKMILCSNRDSLIFKKK